MEPVVQERARGDSARDTTSIAAASKLTGDERQKILQDKRKERQIMLRDDEKKKILDLYRDLPPMPPELSSPEYLVDGQSSYSTDRASLKFYEACACGDMETVCSHTGTSGVPHADLQYGLEKASHGFQVKVVRYLIKERNTKLHARVFTAVDDTKPEKLRSIFLSGDSRLKDLLEAFLDNGWHPNQVLDPEKKGVMLSPPRRTFYQTIDTNPKVALHYQRCMEDLDILKLLLEHGADPTIARHVHQSPAFWYLPSEAPMERKSGDLLHTAVEMGSTQIVDILVSYGAKPEYGSSLHHLIKGFDNMATETRYKMAEHMLSIGDDINGLRNM